MEERSKVRVNICFCLILIDINIYPPDLATFTRCFYRLLDGGDLSLLGEDEEKLYEIELAVFRGLKKKDEVGTGTLADNKKADKLVGEKIFKSFKAYERNKKDGAQEFFSFKK